MLTVDRGATAEMLCDGYRNERALRNLAKMTKRKSWRKVLYEDQGVPDNYVHDTFLDEMKKNLYTRNYDFWTVVQEAGVITQQLSCVCLFVVCFIYMDDSWLSPQFIFLISSSLTLVGYGVTRLLVIQIKENDGRTGWDDLRSAGLFLAFSCGLSPVLMTLTETISTDTIYAMTFFMLLANLFFHDYGANAAMVSQTKSLSAAIFASVCLASRLPSRWHAFSTVSLAFEVFALFPVFRRVLKLNVTGSHNILTCVLGVVTATAILSVSSVGAVLFTLLHLFISFVCPAWLIKLQPYKNNIYGPWDEATIQG